MALEADIFYPQLAQAMGDDLVGRRAVAQYAAVKDFLGELQLSAPADGLIGHHVRRLATMVSHHIHESERPDGAFATALCSNMDGVAVGQLMRARQRERIVDQTRRR